ncbi:TrmO family methyltransferase domain-containing protein [Streptomyces sp. CA-243310]|uniref:TrmO family methyltransferase domain-containing protein n=1 Tax=Streptomyces sp. CA-243310 TaxID=3240056 RepID=UPI003D8B1430
MTTGAAPRPSSASTAAASPRTRTQGMEEFSPLGGGLSASTSAIPTTCPCSRAATATCGDRTGSAISRCRLVKVDGLDLHVEDLDAVDGTPVLEVKPWFEEMGPRGKVRQAQWDHRHARRTTTPPPRTDHRLRGRPQKRGDSRSPPPGQVAGGGAAFHRALRNRPRDVRPAPPGVTVAGVNAILAFRECRTHDGPHLPTRIPILTLRQPWASANVEDGKDWKDVANRSQPTSYQGPLYIHAGVGWDGQGVGASPDRGGPSGDPRPRYRDRLRAHQQQHPGGVGSLALGAVRSGPLQDPGTRPSGGSSSFWYPDPDLSARLTEAESAHRP